MNAALIWASGYFTGIAAVYAARWIAQYITARRHRNMVCVTEYLGGVEYQEYYEED